MLSSILTEELNSCLSKIPYDSLNEIRLRNNKKIVVSLEGKSYYLSLSGLSSDENKAVICTKPMIDYILKKATEFSLYALNHQIKQGFITLGGGIRIGLSGEVVLESNNLKTIKNCSSLNIRIPHQIKNCSLNAFNYIINSKFYNTLIISPPGCGKTTFIRDLLYQLSKNKFCYNILVIDERYEIAASVNGSFNMDVGDFTDVYSGCSKRFGFENGIRSMRPDIIVTDEIASQGDIESVSYAASCGVSIVASVHAENVEDLKNKPYFDELIKNKIFKRYVVLSNKKGPGTYEGIYDENLNFIFY